MRKNIRFLVMDVDGTLTDGKIYMGTMGELFKAFDVKDGYGIKEMLPKYNICPVIITARDSVILQNRCEELGIQQLYQGIRNKVEKLKEIIAAESLKDNVVYTFQNVAYIGDDVLDLQCMKPISEAGGIVGCPADSVESVRKCAQYICKKKGGNGAVREFIEWLEALDY